MWKVSYSRPERGYPSSVEDLRTAVAESAAQVWLEATPGTREPTVGYTHGRLSTMPDGEYNCRGKTPRGGWWFATITKSGDLYGVH